MAICFKKSISVHNSAGLFPVQVSLAIRTSYSQAPSGIQVGMGYMERLVIKLNIIGAGKCMHLCVVCNVHLILLLWSLWHCISWAEAVTKASVTQPLSGWQVLIL